MNPERLLRAILPDVLIDNFDIVNFDKSADRFDIYLDEKKVQLKEDKTNPDIIPMVLVSIVQSKISYSWAPLISMFVNVNGLTSLGQRNNLRDFIFKHII